VRPRGGFANGLERVDETLVLALLGGDKGDPGIGGETPGALEGGRLKLGRLAELIEQPKRA
jgi:hypothetical protein